MRGVRFCANKIEVSVENFLKKERSDVVSVVLVCVCVDACRWVNFWPVFGCKVKELHGRTVYPACGGREESSGAAYHQTLSISGVSIS